MKISVILLGAALYLVSSIEADITTNTPFKAVTWNGGEDVKVVWDDDGKAPNLAQIGITSVDLMAGDNTKQVLVSNIGKVPATAKTIDYKVPKNVGPPGDFYFIKYTAGSHISFSGSFSIANVNGKITGFDPKSLDDPKAGGDPKADPQTKAPATPTNPATPPTSDPKTGGAKDSKTPNTAPASSPAAPASSSTVGSAAQSSPNANNAANLLSSFAGVSTAAVALALTYLY